MYGEEGCVADVEANARRTIAARIGMSDIMPELELAEHRFNCQLEWGEQQLFMVTRIAVLSCPRKDRCRCVFIEQGMNLLRWIFIRHPMDAVLGQQEDAARWGQGS